MDIACIDTQILFWAIIKSPPKGNEHLVSTATDFIKWVEEQQYRVIVPSIVIAELLIPVPPEDHPTVMAQMTQDYRIIPFDLVAAQKFAELRRSHIIKNRLHHLIDSNRPGATREALKADVMIIATALVNNAKVLFSHNKDLRKLAEGYIETKSFDDVSFQRSMQFPDDSE